MSAHGQKVIPTGGLILPLGLTVWCGYNGFIDVSSTLGGFYRVMSVVSIGLLLLGLSRLFVYRFLIETDTTEQ